MGRGYCTTFHPTPPCSPPTHSTPSSNNSVPSLWSVTDSGEGEDNEDFEDALDGSVGKTVVLANGGEEGNSVSAGGLGGDAWELFDQTGVREDSL
jgi:hypothetical protein